MGVVNKLNGGGRLELDNPPRARSVGHCGIRGDLGENEEFVIFRVTVSAGHQVRGGGDLESEGHDLGRGERESDDSLWCYRGISGYRSADGTRNDTSGIDGEGAAGGVESIVAIDTDHDALCIAVLEDIARGAKARDVPTALEIEGLSSSRQRSKENERNSNDFQRKPTYDSTSPCQDYFMHPRHAILEYHAIFRASANVGTNFTLLRFPAFFCLTLSPIVRNLRR